MREDYCCLCDATVEHYSWRHTDWFGNGKHQWACGKHFASKSHEFIPDSIKQDREKYARDIVQPYRNGEFSKEFKETYPEISKDMVKQGVISKHQYKNAKEVWKGDVAGWK